MAEIKYPHRGFCMRDHRIIGNYLSICAWNKKLDCIVLHRFDIEELLGVKKINRQRIIWFIDDLKPWFPHHEAYSGTGKQINFIRHRIFNSPINVGYLFLSRVPIDKYLPAGTMNAEERIKGMPRNSPKTNFIISRGFRDLFGKKRPKRLPSTLKMVADTTLLASGLEDPNILLNLE